MKKDLVSSSKHLSLVMRHKAERAGLTLDPQGRAPVDELVRGLSATRPGWTGDILHDVVATTTSAGSSSATTAPAFGLARGTPCPSTLGSSPRRPYTWSCTAPRGVTWSRFSAKASAPWTVSWRGGMSGFDQAYLGHERQNWTGSARCSGAAEATLRGFVRAL